LPAFLTTKFNSNLREEKMPHMLELDKELLDAPLGGWGAFDFSAVERNLAMAELDKQEENGGGTEKMAAKVTSTGTTIVASLYKVRLFHISSLNCSKFST
jgi:hypothetical protein